MIKKALFILASFCYLSGCATSYQPSGATGGYSDMAYNQDTSYVAINTNGYTSTETAASYLLRRCAEITLSKGYKYFIIINLSNTTYNGGGGLISLATSNLTDGSGIKAQIKMLKNNYIHTQAFDAAVILSNYQKKL